MTAVAVPVKVGRVPAGADLEAPNQPLYRDRESGAEELTRQVRRSEASWAALSLPVVEQLLERLGLGLPW